MAKVGGRVWHFASIWSDFAFSSPQSRRSRSLLLLRGEVARPRADLHPRSPHLDLDAVEARLAQGVGHVGQLVLSLDLRGDPAQLSLQRGLGPVGQVHAARVSGIELKQARS